MTSAQKVIDQELAQFGWVESPATNSIIDFKSPKSTELEEKTHIKKSNVIDTFICHLIFYLIFCYSLFLYLAVDLGFSSFVVNKVTAFIKIPKKTKIPFLISSLYN